MTELRERASRAYWTVALRNGLANDLRQWDERNWDDDGFKCHSPALDAKTKGRVMEAMDAAIAAVMQDLEAPSEGMIAEGGRYLVMHKYMESDAVREAAKWCLLAMLSQYQKENGQ